VTFLGQIEFTAHLCSNGRTYWMLYSNFCHCVRTG